MRGGGEGREHIATHGAYFTCEADHLTIGFLAKVTTCTVQMHFQISIQVLTKLWFDNSQTGFLNIWLVAMSKKVSLYRATCRMASNLYIPLVGDKKFYSQLFQAPCYDCL